MGLTESKEPSFGEFYETVQKNNAAARSMEIEELSADILEHMRGAALAGRTSLTFKSLSPREDYMPKKHYKKCKLLTFLMHGETMRQIRDNLINNHGVDCEYICDSNVTLNAQINLDMGRLIVYFKPRNPPAYCE